jgi:tripeptidyl-peptidase I
MIVINLVFLGSLIALVSATPTARLGMVVRSSKFEAPKEFAHQGAAPADKYIPLRIALVQNDIGLKEALYDVLTPSSANSGKHLSKEQVYSCIFISCNDT